MRFLYGVVVGIGSFLLLMALLAAASRCASGFGFGCSRRNMARSMKKSSFRFEDVDDHGPIDPEDEFVTRTLKHEPDSVELNVDLSAQFHRKSSRFENAYPLSRSRLTSPANNS